MDAQMMYLKNKLKSISELVVNKDDAIYMDYPLHLNVGDMLIQRGTESFFQDEGINIRMRRAWQNFNVNELKKIVGKKTTIFIQSP